LILDVVILNIFTSASIDKCQIIPMGVIFKMTSRPADRWKYGADVTPLAA
jgi:hypothetical protein